MPADYLYTMNPIPEHLQALKPAPKRTKYKFPLRGKNYRPQRYVVHLKDRPDLTPKTK